jgi:hypothetical protein
MKIGGNQMELRTTGRSPAPRRVEKSSIANSLGEEKLREPRPSAVQRERRSAARASRFGTRYAGANERRGMQARFVAQVLGQILDTHGNNAVLAVRAYAHGITQSKETRLVGIV